MNTLAHLPLRALVLTPAQMREEIDTPEPEPGYNRYALMTCLPAADMRIVESAEAHVSGLHLYETPAGPPCVLAFLQRGPLLLRILVPLEAEHAREWLSEALAQGSYLVALDIELSGRLSVVEVPLPGHREALRATRKAAAAPRTVRATPTCSETVPSRGHHRNVRTTPLHYTALVPVFLTLFLTLARGIGCGRVRLGALQALDFVECCGELRVASGPE